MRVKEVRFDVFCKTCEHYDKRETEDPCWDCLNQGWNYDSHKPTGWTEKMEVPVAVKTRAGMKSNKEVNANC